MTAAADDLAAGARGRTTPTPPRWTGGSRWAAPTSTPALPRCSTGSGSTPRCSTVRSSTLSGGQLARCGLAAVLLTQVDVLLLDEPTNDLDVDGLTALESFLAGRRGALVVVSHDRAFLERVATEVLEIDEFTRRGTVFGGGFAAYLEERDRARAAAKSGLRGVRREALGPRRPGPP